MLGEVIAAIAIAVQDAVGHSRASPGLLTAAAAPILTLPPSIVIMVVLVALLLAYHLTLAHRATRQPGHRPAPSDATAPAAPKHGGSPTDPPAENNKSWLPLARRC